jgi:NADH-quinone oxidoreductase subunit N
MSMAVFMLALLGFPLAGGMGFFAKWYVLQAALQAPLPQTRLAIILVLTTVVSASFYLYVVMVMFMRDRPADAPAPRAGGRPTQLVIAAAVTVILVLGLFPSPVVRIARQSTAASFPERVPITQGAPRMAAAP